MEFFHIGSFFGASNFDLIKDLHPFTAGCVARHFKITARRDSYAADLWTVGQARALELLIEKSANKDTQPLEKRIAVIFVAESALRHSEKLVGRKVESQHII